MSQNNETNNSKEENNPQPFVVESFKSNKTYKGLKNFDCGDDTLNRYVKDNLKRDGVRENKMLSLLINPNDSNELIGFISVQSYVLGKDKLPAQSFLHSLPPLVPVIKISMIAVTKKHQKDGWGRQLLRAALDRAINIASVANDVKAVVLDAKEDAIDFYLRHRFSLVEATPDENGTYLMFLSIRDLLAMDAKRKQIEESAAS